MQVESLESAAIPGLKRASRENMILPKSPTTGFVETMQH